MTKSNWILLAEDNAIEADLALRALKSGDAGDKVVLAKDGSEVLDCLHRHATREGPDMAHPAVILLDLKMPKVDGLEVLRQIKSDPDLRQIPVVMFTSSREETDLTRCYELGVNAYVVKPVAFTDYCSVLQQVWSFWVAINELPPDVSPQDHPMRPLLASAG